MPLIACYWMPDIGIACERARLPHLREEAVALAGVDAMLAAVSEQATNAGVRAAQTVSAARALCPALIVLPYDRRAYEEAAQCVWDLLAVESSFVEPLSPELCYVELRGPDLLERAQAMARYIATAVGIPVQAGMARSKFVAREAAQTSRNGRKQEVMTIPLAREAAFLAPMPIERLTHIDAKLKQKLMRLGLKTLGDVLALPPSELRHKFREVGLLLQRLAVGDDGERVRARWPPQSIAETIEFEDEVCDRGQLEEALRICAGRIAETLREQREFCRAVTLVVGMAGGCFLQETEKLVSPADSLAAIFRAALRLYARMPADRPLLEVTLRGSDIGIGSGAQLSLLDDNQFAHGLPHERRHRLEATLAHLRKKFGIGAVVTAGMLKQARRIRLWTYPLGHLFNEPVQVATDARGSPTRFWRRGRQREVRSIQNRWRETDWHWGRLTERMVYRVEVEPSGLCELHHLDVQWHLAGVAD